jgi:hypothetical protein
LVGAERWKLSRKSEIVIAFFGRIAAEEELAERAGEVERRWGLSARGWVAMARRSGAAGSR